MTSTRRQECNSQELISTHAFCVGALEQTALEPVVVFKIHHLIIYGTIYHQQILTL